MPDYSRFMSKRVEGLEASEIREILKLLERPNIISLAGGLPDPATFPVSEIAEIARRVIEERGASVLQYAPSRGVSDFIEAIRLFSERFGLGVRRDDAILATVGSQEALYLAAEVMLDPGDYVIVENPTYLTAVKVFKYRGVRFLPVPLDDNGMRTEVLEDQLRRLKSEGGRVKLAYLVPTFQNPTGVVMSNERRKHLLELAEEYDFLVLEDDPYGLIRFEEIDVKTLKALDRGGRVLYMSSFSKILSPGLRLGWIAGPEEVIAYLEKAKQHVNLHTSTLSQYIAAEAIRAGIVERNLPKLRELYKRKRDAMLEALEEYFPREARWTRPRGGFFVFVYLPQDIDTSMLLRDAVERGVAYVPGASFYVDGSGRNTMRLNYSYPSIEAIREGVRKLGELLRERLGG